jgi:hypothetical protein
LEDVIFGKILRTNLLRNLLSNEENVFESVALREKASAILPRVKHTPRNNNNNNNDNDDEKRRRRREMKLCVVSKRLLLLR